MENKEKAPLTFDHLNWSNARMAFKTENGIVWATKRQMEIAKQLIPEQREANRKRIERILKRGCWERSEGEWQNSNHV